MMSIAFHIVSFMDTSNQADKISKAVEFTKDYVINPNIKKSFCDKKSIDRYGIMPSQKGKVTTDEVEAIAKYMFEYYTPIKLQKIQKAIEQFESLPKGEQLAIKYKCVSCHNKDSLRVGPSFKSIGKKYKTNKKQITQSITQGSKGKWKNARGATMPAFNKISDANLRILRDWIIKLYI